MSESSVVGDTSMSPTPGVSNRITGLPPMGLPWYAWISLVTPRAALPVFADCCSGERSA